MPETPEGPDSLEGMAFQLLLQKMTSLERAMAGIPPLLKKIIDHLEAQAKQPEVEVATYAALYPALQDEDGETPPEPVPVSRGPHWGLWRWFTKE